MINHTSLSLGGKEHNWILKKHSVVLWIDGKGLALCLWRPLVHLLRVTTVVTQHLQRWKSTPKKSSEKISLFICLFLRTESLQSLSLPPAMYNHRTVCHTHSLTGQHYFKFYSVSSYRPLSFALLSSHPHTLTSLTSPSSLSSSSLSSSAYQFFTVDCTVSLLSSVHTRTGTHTSGNSQSVYMHREGGYLPPSLSLPLSLLVSLQSWAAGAAEAESRESSNSQSVRHRQRDRPADRETGTQTDWQHHRTIMDWIRTMQPVSGWDRRTWLLFFGGTLL